MSLWTGSQEEAAESRAQQERLEQRDRRVTPVQPGPLDRLVQWGRQARQAPPDLQESPAKELRDRQAPREQRVQPARQVPQARRERREAPAQWERPVLPVLRGQRVPPVRLVPLGLWGRRGQRERPALMARLVPLERQAPLVLMEPQGPRGQQALPGLMVPTEPPGLPVQ
jgi:hypothetical protein